ncbi:hypothetical protein JHL17_22985 [Azospirillum sp. YIM B02556]|uniref:Uncharacterized protein n=1 Tax=Azospirillum endophyticum TaxID=2800326 RepID=A0ABS1FA85_9PROT|nr:hypothetical protein [Azospirillum endophyticum]MBK1840273.1 hypothetical protein [Azospirillum endophyticum]
MADLLHVAARLRALQNGQAVPIVSQRQMVIQPHARILTLLSMAGEDTSVHAAALGRFGEPARIRVVADPRRRDDQYALLRWLLPFFEEYYAQCRAEGTFPQIWVSSAGALGHLDTLADRLRFTDEADIQRLGNLWTYAGERSPVAGQQALISASGALRLHYATGQQEAEDEHLLALLTWIEPPPGRDIYAAVATAEATPMGVKTDPQFDRLHLQPAITDFHNAGSDAERAFHQTRIQQMLEGVIRPIYTATQRAMALLSAPRWQANPALEELAEQESGEFARFMLARDQGHRLPYRDSPKVGAMKIAARERAIENVKAGMLRHDRAARERGVVKGGVLRGQLADVREHHLGPRWFEYDLVLTSRQDGLHLRPGDKLWLMDGRKLSLQITGIERNGPFTWVTGRVGEGKNAAKKMSAGPTLDFGPGGPDWRGLGRALGQMKTRLTHAPWTHSDVLPAATPSRRAMPANLRAAVEDLT